MHGLSSLFSEPITVDELEENLQCIGGTAGVVTLTAIAAGAAYYYSTRPVPEKPLVPLHNQCPIEDVSKDPFSLRYRYPTTPSLAASVSSSDAHMIDR